MSDTFHRLGLYMRELMRGCVLEQPLKSLALQNQGSSFQLNASGDLLGSVPLDRGGDDAVRQLLLSALSDGHNVALAMGRLQGDPVLHCALRTIVDEMHGTLELRFAGQFWLGHPRLLNKLSLYARDRLAGGLRGRQVRSLVEAGSLVRLVHRALLTVQDKTHTDHEEFVLDPRLELFSRELTVAGRAMSEFCDADEYSDVLTALFSVSDAASRKSDLEVCHD